MDISGWISHHALWSPDKVAIRFEGAEITYSEFEEDIARLAGALWGDLHVREGDRVAFLGLNSPELLTLLFACARIGAIFVPLNSRLTVEQHRIFIGNFDPAALFAESAFQQNAERCLENGAATPLVIFGERSIDDPDVRSLETLASEAKPLPWVGDLPSSNPVLIAYTLGTTGVPKGAVLTNEAFISGAANSCFVYEMTRHDQILTFLPMFHIGGSGIHTLPALHIGATVNVHRQFDPALVLREVSRYRITHFVAAPSMCRAIFDEAGWKATDLSSLRSVAIGSTRTPPEMLVQWLARGVTAHQIYGMTEAIPPILAVPMENARWKPGSMGISAPYCQVRIVDENMNDVSPEEPGEMVLCGPVVINEYWNNPDATARAFTDRWFHTGDVAHMDRDGYFYMDDRAKDIIIVGPSNVYPADLERILDECDAIEECAVVARPDSDHGEVPVACVIVKEGHTIEESEVRALFNGRLAEYQLPREVLFMESMPHTALGKVQKGKLRELLAT